MCTDFIFAVSPKQNLSKILVLEIERGHLGSLDADEKGDLLSMRTHVVAWGAAVPVGVLCPIKDRDETLEYARIFMSVWKAQSFRVASKNHHFPEMR